MSENQERKNPYRSPSVVAAIITGFVSIITIVIAGIVSQNSAAFQSSLQLTAQAAQAMDTATWMARQFDVTATGATLPATINANNTLVTQTLSANIAPNLEDLIYEEDFNSTDLSRFAQLNGYWSIKNGVLDGNSLSENGTWSYIRLPLSTFSDGAIRYRARLLETSALSAVDGVVFLIFRDTAASRFQFVMNNQYSNGILYFQGESDPWLQLNGIRNVYEHDILLSEWYDVIVCARDSHITVYVNNTLALDINDSRSQRGAVQLAIGPGTHAQFDDLQVFASCNLNLP